MAFVVVGCRPSAALLHRQTGLGAVERLDLTLLINREDDGVGGRIDIETDDVPELLDKLRALRQLERPDTVRRELVSSRMRCTERRLTPATLASSRPVQWVLSPGGGPKAKSTTR